MILSLDGLVRNCFLLEIGLSDCIKYPAFTALSGQWHKVQSCASSGLDWTGHSVSSGNSTIYGNGASKRGAGRIRHVIRHVLWALA